VQDALVANELQLLGSAMTTGTTPGVATARVTTAGGVSFGVQGAGAGPDSGAARAATLPASASSSSANPGPSVPLTARPGAGARATSVVVSYALETISRSSGTANDIASSVLDSEALADVAVSLVTGRGDGVRRATGHG
jgi:hypothetical protein